MAKRLSEALREELSDARLVLDTAGHNVQALLRDGDVEQSLANAIAMAEQGLAALKRVRDRLG
jgi:hypothetical protein